jgi:hypothetical protein
MSNITELSQTLTPIYTPAEALARFKYAIKHKRLKQKTWHRTDAKGRWIVCALSILGPNVNSAQQCPASIMPVWVAQLVPIFFDNQSFSVAVNWGLQLYTELDRLNGIVAEDNFEKWRTLSKKLLKLEAKADAYAEAYANAYAEAYANGYAYGYAYSYADANAYAEAYANANAKMAEALIQVLKNQPTLAKNITA